MDPEIPYSAARGRASGSRSAWLILPTRGLAAVHVQGLLALGEIFLALRPLDDQRHQGDQHHPGEKQKEVEHGYAKDQIAMAASAPSITCFGAISRICQSVLPASILARSRMPLMRRVSRSLSCNASNAVKLCNGDDGLVTIAVRSEAGSLRVDVSDNGVGIAKKDHKKIFERFQQTGGTLIDKPQGTGLGLPICLHILERFGGQIWLESELGKGSIFSFRIPPARQAVRTRRVVSADRLMWLLCWRQHNGDQAGLR